MITHKLRIILGNLIRTEASATEAETATWRVNEDKKSTKALSQHKKKRKKQGVDVEETFANDDDDDNDLRAVFCPAGQEQDCQNNVCQELCRPCEIGFYRTGDNPYSSCDLCPNNTRTTTTGSTSVNDCTICKSTNLVHSCYQWKNKTMKESIGLVYHVADNNKKSFSKARTSCIKVKLSAL